MTDLASIIIAIISLVIVWAIVSIPVWISAKILASRRASFGRAMVVTLFETGWIRAAGIAIVAIIVFVMIGVVIALVTNLFVHNVPPIITTQPFQV